MSAPDRKHIYINILLHGIAGRGIYTIYNTNL